MARNLVSLLLFVLLAFGSATGFGAALRDRMLDYPAELQLIAARDVTVPEWLEATLTRRLSQEPLNAAAFNTYYVSQVHQGVEVERREAMVDVLADMGWRNSSAQRNLILEAVRRNDLEMALLRADGLLRRDKMTEFLLPVMRQMEADEEASKVLVDRLSRMPNWREGYFADVANLQDAGARAARQALLERMIMQKRVPSREEMKRSLDAFVSWNEPARAAAVVGQLNRVRVPSTINNDPQFEQAGGLMGDDRKLALPTEWELSGRRGVSARIEGGEGVRRLSIHWNGGGSPELARQLVALGPVRSPQLEVALAEGQEDSDLSRIEFQWSCRGRRAMPFDRVVDPLADKSIIFQLDGQSPCDYGYLRIAGRPQSADLPVDIAFKSVALKAQ